MFAVETYAAVRRFVFVEGKSRREAARIFGLSRDTISKMCRYSAPPGYVRSKPPERPKLGPLVPVIDAILEADKTAPPKQRHTAKRIFERLRIEHGYAGGYTVVKDYVRIARARSREVFVPLAHPPGHAQVDFGECIGIIGGVRMKLHVFCFDLPQSDACFIKACPAETTEAFLDGHVSAFAFFGGVPISILYDNLKIAVACILGDGKRQRTRAFTELVSHYLFQERFGRPGKGNDKGKVEALVKYSRTNFLTPVPHAASFDALNAMLEERCRARQAERAGRHEQTIGERLVADQAVLRALPEPPFEPCDKRPGKVSSTALVRYRMNDYSVPTAYGFRDVLVKGFVDEVAIICGAREIARHPRVYGRGQFVFDPKHYLALLEQKPGALDQAAPLQSWTLPEPLQHLRRLLEARMGNRGKREFIQALRLTEVFPEPVVAAAAMDAIRLGAISFDAVKQLVIAKIEHRPAKLDLCDLSARSQRQDDFGRRLYGSRFREGGMTTAAPPTSPAPPQVLLAHHLRQLKLPTFLREYEKVAAAREGLDHVRFLLRLAELELIDRERRMVERRIRAARFPAVKSFDTFDFGAIPSLNKPLTLELARCEYGVARENIIALGNSGTGKTHACLALGLAACQRGFSVAFVTAAGLVHQLMEAR
jgi:transposase